MPLLACAVVLVVSGCAQSSNTPGSLFASAPSRPKSVVISDFIAAAEVTATDNDFNTRLERRGNYPILERRQRTIARVNDEIVATIIADLRAAGLEAHPGNESTLGYGDDALLVTGRLRPPERKGPGQVGFGPGRGNVAADMTVTRASAGKREQLLTFATDVQSGRKIPPGNAASVAARNQDVAAALAAQNALPERLSSDVEAQARALGRAIAEKVVALAKERDWLPAPQVAQAAPETEQRMRVPEARPVQKPAAKPSAQKPAASQRPEAPEDEEPPDTEGPDEPTKR
jgi:hypothetical protein